MMLGMLSFPSFAQDAGETSFQPRYGYQVQVLNQPDVQAVNELNAKVDPGSADQGGMNIQRGGFFTAVGISLADALVDRVVDVTSNLFSLGIDYVSDATNSAKRSERFNQWRMAWKAMNTFEHKLPVDTERYNDFYCTQSNQGPYEVKDLKFEGLECSYYIETEESAILREHGLGDGRSQDVFFIKCSLRNDKTGIEMLKNKRFLLQVDSLVFYPDYCTIPNDGANRQLNHFNFEKNSNLQLTLKIKFLTNLTKENGEEKRDLGCGEFVIQTTIGPNNLVEVDNKRVFIYSRENPEHRNADAVSVSGYGIVIPRSYNGNRGMLWDTGKYRVDVTLQESGMRNPEYYFTSAAKKKLEKNPGDFLELYNNEKSWNKKVWMEEWKQFNKMDPSEGKFFPKAYVLIKEGFTSSESVEAFMKKVSSAVINYESEELHRKAQELGEK